MSGNNLLLDTNTALYLLKGDGVFLIDFCSILTVRNRFNVN
jgi:hypothetical protein